MRVCLGLALIVATPAWSQLEVIPFETPPRPSDEDRMLTPPHVSGEAYPATVGSQARSNYLSAGLTVAGTYGNKVTAGSSTTPVGDAIYSILPTIALNQTTPRKTLTLQYSPGFTLYQNSSALDGADQTAILNFMYRLSQHTTIRLDDSFQKTTNTFSQLPTLPGETPSCSAQSSQAGVVATYADRLSNIANAVLSYQFSRNGMIGASGAFIASNYTNSMQAAGLNNSNWGAGCVFYSRRLSRRQYIGVTYQYSSSHANQVSAETNPVDTDVHTQTFLAFYTIYLNPSLSLSFSAGSLNFDATHTSSSRVTSWEPSTKAAIGWQRSHTNFVATYSRTIAGNTGLSGVFNSTEANASASWQMARTWIAALAAGYLINTNVTPSFHSSDPGGHSYSGTFSLQHSMGQHLAAEFGYAFLRQSYNDVAAISANPDSARVSFSVRYQFTRPLGR